MSSELIMNDADELGDNIYLNFGYSLEQNTSTRIPIVDIRYSKNIQSSAHYTSKQKQDIALQEFGQNTLKISLSEYMYFSTTTFFTVGYGDVQLKGRVPKLLAQSEMFVAGFFNIIFVPLILYVITEYISKRRNRDKNEVHNRK
ncbi:potassium channel family protein [Paenibacillus sp. FSL H7-0716]|nr:potassium channel family protein [Paenibacillus odorifer]